MTWVPIFIAAKHSHRPACGIIYELDLSEIPGVGDWHFELKFRNVDVLTLDYGKLDIRADIVFFWNSLNNLISNICAWPYLFSFIIN